MDTVVPDTRRRLEITTARKPVFLYRSQTNWRRTLSEMQNHSLAAKLTHLRTEDIAINLIKMKAEVAGNLAQLTSYEVLLIFRRSVVLQSRSDTVNVQGAISQCLDILTEFLMLQSQQAPNEFQLSKMALKQAFCSLAPILRLSPQAFPNFLDGFYPRLPAAYL